MVGKGHNYGLCNKCGKTHIHPFKGKKRSKSWCKNISKGKKGRIHSEQSKRNMSIGMKKAYSDGSHISWNKGYTKETHPSVLKISNSNLGHIPWNKGKTGVYSNDSLKQMSESRKQYFIENPDAKQFGDNNPSTRPDVRKKISLAHIGKKLSDEHKKAIRDTMKGRPLPEETRKKRFGKGNPFYGKKHTIESRNKITISLKKTYRDNPERHGNRVMTKNGFISHLQKQLFEIVRKKHPDAELEYPIKTNESIRFADIGIPSIKYDLEADGTYWHKDKEKDEKRTRELNEVGWTVLRFLENEDRETWKNRLKEIYGGVI